jgi:hypothetical protein
MIIPYTYMMINPPSQEEIIYPNAKCYAIYIYTSNYPSPNFPLPISLSLSRPRNQNTPSPHTVIHISINPCHPSIKKKLARASIISQTLALRFAPARTRASSSRDGYEMVDPEGNQGEDHEEDDDDDGYYVVLLDHFRGVCVWEREGYGS